MYSMTQLHVWGPAPTSFKPLVADIKQKGSLCTRVLVDLEDPWQLQAEQLVSCEPCPSIVCYLCGCVPTL